MNASNPSANGDVPTPTKRVIAYVDGFNLYFALREKGWKRFYWLNVHALASRFLDADQRLVATRYYTSRVIGSASKQARQSAIINALLTVPEVTVRYGQYRMRPRLCEYCGVQDSVPGEKMTDVTIATDMLVDAMDGALDVALLVSADSDLTAPLKAIRDRHPGIQVVVLFPPGRTSGDLAKYAHGTISIGRSRLNQSQFPDPVVQANGIEIVRPLEWAANPSA